MKLLITTLIIFAFSHAAWPQCEKDIETNPLNPINNEFLPLKNDWYPGPNAYTVNSFLNSSINWYPPSSITLDLDDNWSEPFGSSGNLNMTNPYGSDHAENHINQTPNDDTYKDFRWEDGWELLWINLGTHFNGDPLDDPASGTYFATGNYDNDPGDPEIIPEIAPSNIPYFVIYNRYRGTLRLFANVWQDNLNPSFQRIAVTMKYTDDSGFNQDINGLFRHASQIDRALNQTSEYTQMVGPRLQPVNSSDWMVAEFQMAFDPCICMKNYDGDKDPGRIEFVFETIETLKVDMLSRTIEIESAIDSALINEDFLNLSQFDSLNYRPGTRMYSSLQDMLDAYQQELEFYNDSLDDYDGGRNEIVSDLIEVAEDVTTDLITSGIVTLISGIGGGPAGAAGGIIAQSGLSTIEESAGSSIGDSEILKDLIKGLVGIGVDQLSMEVFGKEPTKPTKPTQPVANFSETSYKGTVTKTFYQRTPPLLVPGGIDAYEPSPDAHVGYGKMRLSPRIFPAYNKVLGQTALLERPELNMFSMFGDAYYTYPDSLPFPGVGLNFDFKLKFDSLLKVAINRSLDFDLEKTKTYVNIELVLESRNLEADTSNFTTSVVNSNMYRTHALPQEDNSVHLQYNSKWIPLELLGQYVFSLNIRDTYTGGDPGPWPSAFLTKIRSIKIKLMHDMYFDQMNSWDQQNNTTQVRTYNLVDFGTGLSIWDLGSILDADETALSQYIAGEVTIGNDIITVNHPLVHSVIGDTIFINGENIIISDTVQVESGYILVLQALNQIKKSPGVQLTPKVHLRIKRDFYETPIFEYISNSEVYNFCNNSNQYQANVLAISQSPDNQPNHHTSLNELVEEWREVNSIQLYPNPARDLLTLRSSHLDMTAITIHDLSGRPIKQETLQAHSRETQINLSGIAPGTYIVRVDCGGEVFSEKLVVTR